MAEKEGNKSAGDSAGRRRETLAGFLASALDMEDEISNSVYQDYMNPDNWPAGVSLDVFQQIRKYLTVLIRDTERHRKTIHELIEQHEKD